MPGKHLLQICALIALALINSGCGHELYVLNDAYTPQLTHGNQYYSYRTAKYLGSDNSDSGNYRIIDSMTYKRIWPRGREIITDKNIIRALRDSSCIITIDSRQVQSDLQKVRDYSLEFKVEFEMYIFLNRRTGEISSRLGKSGDDSSSCVEFKQNRTDGITTPDIEYPPKVDLVLIGQAHGHPPAADIRKKVDTAMSPADKMVARCLQIPVYGIDAMEGEWGESGNIHRVDPVSLEESLNIAKTQGNAGARADIKRDIALEALEKWSRSGLPDFKCIEKSNPPRPGTYAPSTAHN
jgi:hypothetical protein